MTERPDEAQELVCEYELDAPPEKVWRAVTIAEFRDRWLPGQDLATQVPVSIVPGRQIEYLLREDRPPFLESIVTFELAPGPAGGTRFRITHRLAANAVHSLGAANSNKPVAMAIAA